MPCSVRNTIPSRRGGRRWTPPGKAVLLSGLTVLISLSAVMLVPSPAFRSMSDRHHGRGSLRPRGDADPAPRGPRQAGARWSTSSRSPGPMAAITAPPALRAGVESFVAPAVPASAGLRWWCCSPLRCRCWNMKTGMPSIKVVPKDDPSRVGYDRISAAFGPGAPGTLQVHRARFHGLRLSREICVLTGGSPRFPRPRAGGGRPSAGPGRPYKRPLGRGHPRAQSTDCGAALPETAFDWRAGGGKPRPRIRPGERRRHWRSA